MRIYNDFSTSVKKALSEIDPNWMNYEGLIICGTHTPMFEKEQIEEIREARKTGLPFLGICFGHQLAAIEYAQTVLGIEDATSQELDVYGTFVVKKNPGGLRVGMFSGETYWHNYEVDYRLVPKFETDKPPNFITCQYHPEYQSSIDRHHRLLVKFIELCKKKNGFVDGPQP